MFIIAFILALGTLGLGAFLLLATKAHQEFTARPCKLVGYLIVLLSIVVLLVSGYIGAKSAYLANQQMSMMMQRSKAPPRMPMPAAMKNSIKAPVSKKK